MSLIMQKAEKVAVGAEAVSVDAARRNFLLVNTSETAIVYFREAFDDEEAAAEHNSFALLPGQTTPLPLNAKTLSMMAAEAAEVHILYVREGC